MHFHGSIGKWTVGQSDIYILITLCISMREAYTCMQISKLIPFAVCMFDSGNIVTNEIWFFFKYFSIVVCKIVARSWILTGFCILHCIFTFLLYADSLIVYGIWRVLREKWLYRRRFITESIQTLARPRCWIPKFY